MKILRKITLATISLAMLLGVASCGKKDDPLTTTTVPTTTTPGPTTTDPTTTTSAPSTTTTVPSTTTSPTTTTTTEPTTTAPTTTPGPTTTSTPTPVTEYTVNFNTNGGSPVSSQTVQENTKLVKPEDPQKTGFTFDGWYLGDNKFDFNTPVTANWTLEAHWNAVPKDHFVLTIEYKINGESQFSIETDPKLYVMPDCTAELGYEFVGWVDTEGNAVTEEEICSIVLDSNKSITLVAKFNKIGDVYTVSFETDSDSTVDSKKVLSGSTVDEPDEPIKDGYTFIGWYESLTDTEAFDFENTKIASDLVLYAKWEKNYVLTIEYYLDNTLYSTNQYKDIKNFTYNVKPSKTGYTFKGWLNEEGKIMSSADIQALTLTEDTTIKLYAKFEEGTATTHFDNNLKKDGPLTQEAFPSLGNPNMLVIPVNLDSTYKTDKVLNDIKIAFSGTEEETGWESLTSYYKESSYGKLNINVEFTDWFTPSKTADYYNTYDSDNNDGSNLILHEALSYFDSTIDFSKYDNDNDGYIDGVWLIYNSAVNYESDDSLYWAFTSWDYSEQKYDDKYAYYYAFAGIDFMYEETTSYDTTNIKVDAHTYIHETGHLMGLDDYYDYNDEVGAKGGLWGADMMDFNVGDHGPINKMLLGWIDPIVVTETTTIDLKSFTENGDVLLVSNKTPDSIYEEYFLIEFYTSTGLNKNDLPIQCTNGDCYGIRIMHVDANKNIVNGEVQLAGTYYQTGFKYNNSDTDYKFINMLRADYSSSSNSESRCTDASLFTPTSKVFGVDVCKTYKLHDGTTLFFTMTVNSMTKDNANVTITFTSGNAELPMI